jgi:integrase
MPRACPLAAVRPYGRSGVGSRLPARACADLRGQLKRQAFSAAVCRDADGLIADLKPDMDAVQRARNVVLRAKIEEARILASMLSGDYAKTMSEGPLFAGMAPNGLPLLLGEKPASKANVYRFSSVADLFYAAKIKHDWVVKTAADVKRTLELARGVIGEQPIGAVSVDDVRAVRDALANLPPNYMKKSANKSMTVEAAIATNKSGPTLSRKTQDKHLTMFKQLLIWAENEGYIEKVPGAGIKVAGVGKTNPAEQRNPYSKDQLTAIFRSPLYTGHSADARHKPGPEVMQDGKFWVPLIALYSGMRTGEIVQLLAADLKQDQHAWLFDVSKGEGKSLKTESSKRRVPIDPKLISLGLLKLRAALRAAEQQEYVNKALLGHADKSVHVLCRCTEQHCFRRQPRAEGHRAAAGPRMQLLTHQSFQHKKNCRRRHVAIFAQDSTRWR